MDLNQKQYKFKKRAVEQVGVVPVQQKADKLYQFFESFGIGSSKIENFSTGSLKVLNRFIQKKKTCIGSSKAIVPVHQS